MKEINNERIMAKRMRGGRRPEGENKGENDKLVFAKEREKPSTFMKQPKQPSEKKKIHECCWLKKKGIPMKIQKVFSVSNKRWI